MTITLEEIKRIGKGNIISYSGSEALEAVKKDGWALRYVDERIFKTKKTIFILVI